MVTRMIDINEILPGERSLFYIADMTEELGGNLNGAIDSFEEAQAAFEICKDVGGTCEWQERVFLYFSGGNMPTVDVVRDTLVKRQGETDDSAQARMLDLSIDIFTMPSPDKEDLIAQMGRDESENFFNVRSLACALKLSLYGDPLESCLKGISDYMDKRSTENADKINEGMLAQLGGGDVKKFAAQIISTTRSRDRAVFGDDMSEGLLIAHTEESLRFALRKDPEATAAAIRDALNGDLASSDKRLASMLRALLEEKKSGPVSAKEPLSRQLQSSMYMQRFVAMQAALANPTPDMLPDFYTALHDSHRLVRDLAAQGIGELNLTQGVRFDLDKLGSALLNERSDHVALTMMLAIASSKTHRPFEKMRFLVEFAVQPGRLMGESLSNQMRVRLVTPENYGMVFGIVQSGVRRILDEYNASGETMTTTRAAGIVALALAAKVFVDTMGENEDADTASFKSGFVGTLSTRAKIHDDEPPFDPRQELAEEAEILTSLKDIGIGVLKKQMAEDDGRE